VAEHEKFIRAYVRNWCRPNPWARYEEILYDAIILAAIAELQYDPQRGASFKTLLTHHFKSLGRRTNYQKQMLAGQPDWEPSNEFAPEDEFEGFDEGWLRQFPRDWWEPEKQIRLVFKRKGQIIVVEIQPSCQIRDWSDFGKPLNRGYFRARLWRIINDLLKDVVDLEKIRHAVVGHFGGNAGINVYELLEPKINLQRPMSDLEEQFLNAVRIVRPSLSQREKAVLDWWLASLAGLDKRSLTEIANALSITKGTASKIRNRVEDKLKVHMFPESNITQKIFLK
jgi:DNA-binding CsgD family transcriptional regulator